VGLGGVTIIASILAILVVIVAETYPMFRPPRASRLEPPPAAAFDPTRLVAGAALGVDEYREFAYVVTADGLVEFRPLAPGPGPPPVAIAGLDGVRVTAIASTAKGDRYVIGAADGRVIPFTVVFDVTYPDGRRTVTPRIEFRAPLWVDPGDRRAIRRLVSVESDSGQIVVAQLSRAEVVVHRAIERRSLAGDVTREESRQALAIDGGVGATALAVDQRGENLFVGTSRGDVIRWDLRNAASPRLAETVKVPETGQAPITALGFLIGDRTLIVGDETGGVSSWQVVTPPGRSLPRLTRIHAFEPHAEAVTAIGASKRDKGFLTADASGQLRLHYGTTGATLLSLALGTPPRSIAMAPKADGVVGLADDGRLQHWRLDNPHPEITLAALFGKMWYEGYSGPEYVWQSTGGTDDFEAKFSLTPLIFGTLKGTVYALLFAVPLALLAALYVSEFMHPSLRASLKPVVEIMAALPSVVLGFLAGLWLAPIVERVVPGLLILPLVVPACILVVLLAWRLLPRAVRGRVRPGGELALLLPVVAIGVWIGLALGGIAERWLLSGDYRGWLIEALGLTYDQRNSLVVGIAMGFAVVPIIFTIAEDSLSNVPAHLRAGSLALGATRWQTAIRIVLPTASPGVFSAIMIGFGRAVGETMIVLMATGNTPVLDWSVFNGFRALSANIAVELPEAPEGGTLFRVLFLAAFLLFCLTFIVNTAAEVVRLRLRRRYRYL
jgi:phosphate transport system permease protein